MEGPCRITDATAAYLRNLSGLHLCCIESGQSDVRSAIDSTERNRVDVAEYRMVLIHNGQIAIVDSVVNGEVDLVPHRDVHAKR